MNRSFVSMFSGRRSRASKRNKSNETTTQLEKAEASENESTASGPTFLVPATATSAGYAPAPASSSSSSWSSTPPEVPYASAGVAADMNSSARQLASQTPSQQSQHWMPTPQFLAAKSNSKYLADPSHLQATNERTSYPTSNNDFPFSDFSTNRTNSRPRTTAKPAATTPNSCNGPRVLQRKETRFQEFSKELSELVQDLLDYSKAKTWKKKCMAVVLALLSVLVFYDLLFGKYIIGWLHTFILWMSVHSIEAVFAFIGIFVVATCTCDEGNAQTMLSTS